MTEIDSQGKLKEQAADYGRGYVKGDTPPTSWPVKPTITQSAAVTRSYSQGFLST